MKFDFDAWKIPIVGGLITFFVGSTLWTNLILVELIGAVLLWLTNNKKIANILFKTVFATWGIFIISVLILVFTMKPM